MKSRDLWPYDMEGYIEKILPCIAPILGLDYHAMDPTVIDEVEKEIELALDGYELDAGEKEECAEAWCARAQRLRKDLFEALGEQDKESEQAWDFKPAESADEDVLELVEKRFAIPAEIREALALKKIGEDDLADRVLDEDLADRVREHREALEKIASFIKAPIFELSSIPSAVQEALDAKQSAHPSSDQTKRLRVNLGDLV